MAITTLAGALAVLADNGTRDISEKDLRDVTTFLAKFITELGGADLSIGNVADGSILARSGGAVVGQTLAALGAVLVANDLSDVDAAASRTNLGDLQTLTQINALISAAIIAAGPHGQVDSIVAGANVTVDATDPANPIVASSGGGGGGGLDYAAIQLTGSVNNTPPSGLPFVKVPNNSWDTNGPSSGAVPDEANGKITIATDGDYEVSVNIGGGEIIENGDGNLQIIVAPAINGTVLPLHMDFLLFIDGRFTEHPRSHSQLATLAEDDEVELYWVGFSANETFEMQKMELRVVQLG